MTPMSATSRVRKKTPRKSRVHSAFAAIAVLVGMLTMGLAGLRLLNMSLEQRLTRLNETIENYQEIELDLKNNMASLLSPARVYSVASAKMGMVNEASVKVVSVAVPKSSVSMASLPVKARKGLGELALSMIFRKEAHAQD